MTRRWVSALLVAAISLTAYGAGGGVHAGLALFTDQAARAATFSTAPVFGGVWYYLHNNPTPPTGDTVQQASLPMDLTAPTATVLYNYDTDRDAFPGRLIAAGGSGADETDLTKHQAWRSPNNGSIYKISGQIRIRIWSALRNFENTKSGAIIAYLRYYTSGNSAPTVIGTASLYRPQWGTASTWVEDTLTINVASRNLPPNHQLELKIIVAAPAPGQNPGDDMWFAYDTRSFPAAVTLP